MQAAVYVAQDQIEIREIPIPSPKEKEVLIETRVCGVCATDVHTLAGESISGKDPFPLIPGHELAGEVVGVGSRVENLAPGDQVAVDPFFTCRECEYCQGGRHNHCQNQETLGTTVSGGFAEYVTVPAFAAHKYSSIPPTWAALAEPLSTVLYGQDRIRIESGSTVLVIGAGPIGLMHLQMALLSGAARVAVVDIQHDRLKLAETLGAGATFQQEVGGTQEDRTGDPILECAPEGFDVVIEATGVPAVVESGPRYLKPAGRMLIFGVSPQKETIRIRPYDIYRNDWEIVGAFALNLTLGRALRLLEEERIRAVDLLGKEYPLVDLPQALEDLSRGRSRGKLQVVFR